MNAQDFLTNTSIAYALLMILIVLTALLYTRTPPQRGKTAR